MEAAEGGGLLTTAGVAVDRSGETGIASYRMQQKQISLDVDAKCSVYYIDYPLEKRELKLSRPEQMARGSRVWGRTALRSTDSESVAGPQQLEGAGEVMKRETVF